MDTLRIAAGALTTNKLRSFLTLLGIILATTTLIAVMSVISGMDHVIADNVSSMGADGYTRMSAKPTVSESWWIQQTIAEANYVENASRKWSIMELRLYQS